MKKFILIIHIFVLSIAFADDQPDIYILCEGFWGEGNGSLWSISDGEINQEFNMIGDVSQSIYSHREWLFVANNASSSIQVYRIGDSGVYLENEIDTNGSGPREMLVHNNKLYFTNWNSMDMKVIDLDTYQEVGSVSFTDMPEDIVTDGESIWVSLMLQSDYTDGSKVSKIDPVQLEVIDEYDVGAGPNEMVFHEGNVYISRTWYDENWNAFYGTSMIDSDGSVFSAEYGQGSVCGGGVMLHQESVYRSFNGGIAPIDENLELIESSRIGDYGQYNVYSVESIDNLIYFGLSDFGSSNHVAVVDSFGNEQAFFDTGLLPGDFAKDQRCSMVGDINMDYGTDISDVIELVSFIHDNNHVVDCDPNINGDSIVDILDIVILVSMILG